MPDAHKKPRTTVAIKTAATKKAAATKNPTAAVTQKTGTPADASPRRHWIGVVGRRDSWERLLARDLWWCVSPQAQSGDHMAMYLTRAVSEKHSGIFGIYEITSLDASRQQECRGFGSHVGGLFNVFAHLKLVQAITPALPLSTIRSDPILRHTTFVRRSGQGTAFRLTGTEYSRLTSLSSKKK